MPLAGTARCRSRDTTTSWPSAVPSRRVASFMARDTYAGRPASAAIPSIRRIDASDASVQADGRLLALRARWKRKFVDLSIYLENDVLSDPPMLAPRIEYQQHRDTVGDFIKLLPGVEPEDFPDGEAAAAEWVRLTTHNGTHLDAPWHFHSTMNNGERSITIDEVPLEWCFQPAREARLPGSP